VLQDILGAPQPLAGPVGGVLMGGGSSDSDEGTEA
jgi:hypothetical protein